MRKVRIAPSLLSADFGKLAEDLRARSRLVTTRSAPIRVSISTFDSNFSTVSTTSEMRRRSWVTRPYSAATIITADTSIVTR